VDIKDLLIEGSTKKIYTTSQSDQVIIEFQDVLPKWAAARKKTVNGKAEINNSISSFLFEYLGSYNVPTHYINKLDNKSFSATKLEMIPIIVRVWNLANEEFSQKYGFEVDKPLENPVVELYYKREDLNFPMINEYHAYAHGLCDRSEMSTISRIATKVNAVLKSFFERRQLKLVRFDLEFGRNNHQIYLGDEMSADTMMVWRITDKGDLDKKTFDISGSSPIKAYNALHNALLGKK